MSDLNGQWGWCKVGGPFKRHWETYAIVASLAVPGLGYAGMAYRGHKLARGGVYVIKVGRGRDAMRYVGQSQKIGKRFVQHEKRFGTRAVRRAIYRAKGGKTAREVAEQRRINRYGGIKGGRLYNKVNPIGPGRQHLMRRR